MGGDEDEADGVHVHSLTAEGADDAVAVAGEGVAGSLGVAEPGAGVGVGGVDAGGRDPGRREYALPRRGAAKFKVKN